MKRMIAFLCVPSLLLAGCVPASQPATAVFPQPEVCEVAAPQQGDIEGGFPVALLQQVRQEGKDTLISPLSVLMALSMAANGAAGETKAAFSQTLGGEAQVWNQFCAGLLLDYGQLEGSTRLHLANSVWIDEHLELREDFTQACVDWFGSQVRREKLSAPTAVEVVNRWIEEQTQGEIPDMLQQLDPRTVLLLVNALYLECTWRNEFDPNLTRSAPFFPEEGEPREVEYLSNGIRQERYLHTQSEEGVVLPYDDGRLAFLAVRPLEGGLTSYLAGWDSETLPGLLAQAEETRLLLRLPKFEAQWGESLNQALTNMGLSIAFDPFLADFSALASDALEQQIYVGEVVHRAGLAVHELGTQASAATVVAMPAGGAMPEEAYAVLTLDSPFLYAVVDLELGIPLFLGTFEAGAG